ncbi:hypothetical protein SLS62_000428 [Diatrype stigma]|uniref:Pisatin demethylase n=1 Tax=Diatrype stigma TaxID=117547 RepID=A0AAN9YXH4_9PEZI
MAFFPTTGSIGGTLGLLASCVVSWYLISTFIAWRRLRHIPGPFLASFSYLWFVPQCLQKTYYETNIALHEKYGPLVRVGPNEIVTDDPDVVRMANGAKGVYTKAGWYDGSRLNPYHPTMFNTKDVEGHDKIKAKLSPAYSGRATPGIEDNVEEQIKNLVDLIRSKYVAPPRSGEFRTLDLSRVSGYFTLDVISRVALGKEFGCLQTDSDPHSFYNTMKNHLPMMALTSEIPWIRNIVYSSTGLKLFGPRETDTVGLGKVMGITNKIVRQYYAPNAQDTKDMIGTFVRNGLTQQHCEVETLFMFIAGSDTTSSAIRATMLYILSAPLIYHRLRREISEAVRDGRASSPIKQSEAKALPYLQAVIYEGLRIRSVSLGFNPKVVPPEGDTIHGKFIPGGTSVGMNLASLMRSKSLFGADAGMFRPERFLEIGGAARSEMQRNVELNFGYGRWMCAGKPLAFMELNKVFFELFRAFDFQIVNPRNPMDSSSAVLFMDKDFYVRVTEASD